MYMLLFLIFLKREKGGISRNELLKPACIRKKRWQRRFIMDVYKGLRRGSKLIKMIICKN